MTKKQDIISRLIINRNESAYQAAQRFLNQTVCHYKKIINIIKTQKK